MRSRCQDHRHLAFGASITPMIDVVFLLLIYFVWTSTLAPPEDELPGSLSTRTSTSTVPTDSAAADFESIVVRLDRRDSHTTWKLNQLDIPSLEDLSTRLRELHSIKSDLPLRIDPSPTVPLRDVVAVYDLAHQIGWDQVPFAVRQPD